MRKSKRGAALFDLLRDQPDQGVEALKVPKQVRHREMPAPPRKGIVSIPGRVAESLAVSESPVPSNVSHGSGIVAVDGDRIRLSLTSVTAAAVVFGGLVMVLGAFEIGRRVGASSGYNRGHSAGRESFVAETEDEIEAARRQSPATDLIQGLLQIPADDAEQSEPEKPAEQRADVVPRPLERLPVVTEEEADDLADSARMDSRKRSKWIRDYTYVVAQEFPRGRAEDAERAREFLAESGVLTEIVTYPSGSIQLITLQGYNRNDSTQRKMSEDRLKKVRAIGARYFRQGGGYKLEGYHKTLKDENW